MPLQNAPTGLFRYSEGDATWEEVLAQAKRRGVLATSDIHPLRLDTPADIARLVDALEELDIAFVHEPEEGITRETHPERFSEWNRTGGYQPDDPAALLLRDISQFPTIPHDRHLLLAKSLEVACWNHRRKLFASLTAAERACAVLHSVLETDNKKAIPNTSAETHARSKEEIMQRIPGILSSVSGILGEIRQDRQWHETNGDAQRRNGDGQQNIARLLSEIPFSRDVIHSISTATEKHLDMRNDASSRTLLQNIRDAARTQDGIKREFLEGNLRFIVNIAKQFRRHGLEFPDIFQEGYLGLVRAVEKYDFRRDKRFTTLARWCIRRKITHALHTGGIVKMEETAAIAAQRNEVREEALRQQLGGRMNDGHLEEAGMVMETVRKCRQLRREPLSLETCHSHNPKESLGDSVAALDPEIIETLTLDTLRRTLLRLLNGLTYRQRQILLMRTGLGDGNPYTLEETGRVFKLSRETARLCESRGLLRLMESQRARATLTPYLGDLEWYRHTGMEGSYDPRATKRKKNVRAKKPKPPVT